MAGTHTTPAMEVPMARTYATKLVLVSTVSARSPGLRRLFGSRPMVLLKRETKTGIWWGTISSTCCATFDTEGEARAWVNRTFRHPIDREGLTTMEVRVVREVDRRARERDAQPVAA